MVMELKKIVERFGVKESESIICVNTILLEIEKHKSIPMQLPVVLPKPTPACKDCHYYQDVTNGWGYCKFNSPHFRREQRYKREATGEVNGQLIEDIIHKEYIHTNDYDWCGQFKQR